MKRVSFETKKDAVLALMLARFPFFGILAHRVRLVPDKAKSGGTAATDGRAIYYDQDFMDRMTGASFEFAVFVLAHVIMHLALGHLWRGNGLDQRRWNVACDVVVNRILRECGIPLPPGAIVPETVGLPEHAAELSEEEIYRLLPSSPDVPRQAVPGTGDIMRPGKDNSSSPFASGENGRQDAGKGSGEGDEKGMASTGSGRQDAGDGEYDQAGMTGGEACGLEEPGGAWEQAGEDLEEYWRELVLAAAAASKARGYLPAAIARIVQGLGSPVMDWRILLAEFISAGAEDYDWRRYDRRLLGAYDLYVPTLHSEELEDVVIAVDTSGSIGEEDLRRFLTESIEILRSYTVRGHFLTCDATVHAVVDVCSDTTPEELAGALRGGGGTDFRPVFEWVEDAGIIPRALVYFTDGYGEYPPSPPPYPVLWVLTEGGAAPPWGKAVRYRKSGGT